MTKEEAIKIAQGLITDFKCESETMVEFCNLVIQALEQEPCTDCISRQAVLDIANSSKSNWIDNSVLFKRVNNLPSVTPQQKAGRWIDIDATHSKCDKCGTVFEIASENGEANYCPNCGNPKMQKVKE